MRDDIYGRLGTWPQEREAFVEAFHKQYDGPPNLAGVAAEAACWLRQALEDIDLLQTRWDCLRPEIQALVGDDWVAFFG